MPCMVADMCLFQEAKQMGQHCSTEAQPGPTEGKLQVADTLKYCRDGFAGESYTQYAPPPELTAVAAALWIAAVSAAVSLAASAPAASSACAVSLLLVLVPPGLPHELPALPRLPSPTVSTVSSQASGPV